MHDRGAVLCSACPGIFLLAETGLFDGREATIHFGYARAFTATFPAVPVHPEPVLVIRSAQDAGAGAVARDAAAARIGNVREEPCDEVEGAECVEGASAVVVGGSMTTTKPVNADRTARRRS
jgi:putative intracellular protease/amidase